MTYNDKARGPRTTPPKGVADDAVKAATREAQIYTTTIERGDRVTTRAETRPTVPPAAESGGKG